MNHVKAFTCEEKIPQILKGVCEQTIRQKGKHPVQVGDSILFHGWEGKTTRHSKWSWRMRVTVTEVIDIVIRFDGIRFQGGAGLMRWGRTRVKLLAILDGFENGYALGDWLTSHNNIQHSVPLPFQIIRWGGKEMRMEG